MFTFNATFLFTSGRESRVFSTNQTSWNSAMDFFYRLGKEIAGQEAEQLNSIRVFVAP